MEDLQQARSALEAQARANIVTFIENHGWRYDLFNLKSTANQSSDFTGEFFFCLLGGYSITFEMNKIAFESISSSIGFSRDSVRSPNFQEDVASRLRFLTVNKDGLSRVISYRFPNSKAKTLCSAGEWLERMDLWDLSKLLTISATDARALLITCPGVGLKTASWFLRNIGNGDGLAIIDVHIDRIAKAWHLIPHGLDPQKNYLEIEERMQNHCLALGTCISKLDLALWHYSRGDLAASYNEPTSI